MNESIAYIIKFSICLSLVTLFYYLFLRKITFYNWNRWYLLVYPLACFLFPLLDIGWWMEAGTVDLAVLKELPAMGNWKPGLSPETSEPVNYWTYVYILLLAGSAVMLVRIIIQYLSLMQLSKRATWLAGEAIKLYAVEDSIIPFSFGRSVYVNPSLHSEEDLKEIIRHEMVHVRQHHTADMMMAELILVLNWFNPFAWMLRHAIRQNLEFIADRQVLTHGVDRRQYQFLLVKVVGQRNFSLASHLNFSALKTRIAMMNKIRSARIHLVKFAFAVPLAAVLLLAFRKKSEAGERVEEKKELQSAGSPALRLLEVESAEGWNGLIGVHKDTVPAIEKIYTTGPNKKGYFFRITEKNGKSEVTILDKKKKLVKSMSLEEWEANQSEYEKTYGQWAPPPPPPAAPVPPAAPAAKALPAAPAAPAAPATAPGSAPAPPPVSPASPPAPPTPPAKKDGIVIVGEGNPVMQLEDNGEARVSANAVRLKVQGDKSPLYFVDGKEWHQDDISLINPDQIKSISVLKEESATSKYGDRGKHGVILIETKRGESRAGGINMAAAVGPVKVAPLYIVDGKELAPEEFQKMEPEDIESVSVYKDKKALEKFGEKGRNGVVVIKRKNQ